MPFMKYSGISAAAFQHPLDVQAINSLSKLKGFDLLCRKMMEYGYERAKYIDLIANHVKISPRQCPKIYEIFRIAVETLDVKEPQLFIGQSPEVNAYTSGIENPFIVLNSTLVETLSEDELHAVIGHELGHIKCRHVLYLMVADFVRYFADVISGATFGLGSLLSSGLELALFTWYRKAELSCDRASLLITQNLSACLRVHMILAGGSKAIADQMNTDEFIQQADLYSELDSDTLSRLYKFLITRYQTHPYSVLRAKEIKTWAEGEQYQRILRGEYEKAGTEQEKREGEHGKDGLLEAATETAKEKVSGFLKSGTSFLRKS